MMRADSLLDIHKLYTGQRRHYAFIFGAIFWVAWLASAALGPGNYDLADNVVGGDYLMGYASGLALSDGDVDELFDYDAQLERQAPILGDTGDIEAEASFSFNLPILQWIYVPFSQLPYLWSLAAWSVFGLGLLAGSLRLLGQFSALPLALTFMPVYSNFTFGQNAFISLFLLSLTYVLWSKDKQFLAGLALAALLYKPQLVTGVGLLWLLNARRDWRSLGGFAAGTAVMAGLSFGLMPTAMADYIDFARGDLNNLADADEFPVFHMHNVRGFFELLVPPVADPLWLVAAVAGIAVFISRWRSGVGMSDGDIDQPFWFAAAVLLTMWATPHALIYDWTMLLIPAVLLWQARPSWRPQLTGLYIIGWLAYAVSLPLTLAQQAVLPIALQVSVIFLAFACYIVVRKLASA